MDKIIIIIGKIQKFKSAAHNRFGEERRKCCDDTPGVPLLSTRAIRYGSGKEVYADYR